MKTPEEIAKRALLCIVLTMRANLEAEEPKNRQERIEFVDCAKDWYDFCRDNGLLEIATYNERSFLETPYQKAGLSWAGPFSFMVECINGLLWSIGVHDTIVPYNDLVGPEDQGEVDLFAEKRLEGVIAMAKLRSQEEIEQELDRAVLWHWRGVEADIRPGLITDVRREIHSAFFGNMDEALTRLPLYVDSNYADMLFRNEPVFMIEEDEREVYYYRVTAEYRQKTLEWVLNDLGWDDTTADT